MTRMSKMSTDEAMKVGNKFSGVMTLMFMSISLVKKLPVFRQNTELTNKTRQNIAHQHTEAAVRGAIGIEREEVEVEWSGVKWKWKRV